MNVVDYVKETNDNKKYLKKALSSIHCLLFILDVSVRSYIYMSFISHILRPCTFFYTTPESH